MSNKKHTPTPWHIDGYNLSAILAEVNGYTKVADCHLAGVTGNYALQFEEENKANAKFIVKAVNCHEDLLEALLYIKNQIDEYGCDERMGEDVKEKVFKAIKKATK